MSISLKSLEKPRNRPPILTILGAAGVGKTSLAAVTGGSPTVIIRVEDGTQAIAGNKNVALFPVAETTQDVFDAIQSLATEDHKFETLVIDSVTQFNTLVEKEVLESDPKAKSLASALGGYGAAFNAIAERHRQLREWCGRLSNDKNMTIIFIAHETTEAVSLPDQETFDAYTLRLHKKSVPAYVDNVDAVMHLRLKMFTTGEKDTKKAISSGEREIIAFPQAGNVSKNRFGITEPILFTLGEQPLNAYFPYFNPPAEKAA